MNNIYEIKPNEVLNIDDYFRMKCIKEICVYDDFLFNPDGTQIIFSAGIYYQEWDIKQESNANKRWIRLTRI